MSQIISIFLIIISVIAFLISCTAAIMHRHKENGDIDSQYIDADGDHIYYDRSLIEKKLFRQRFPHITNLRSFSRLLKNL